MDGEVIDALLGLLNESVPKNLPAQIFGFPAHLFVAAAEQVVARNAAIGFRPAYDPAWQKENFQNASSVYLRPFTYSEPAIGLGLSATPWVVIIATPVSAYFKEGSTAAITTEATPVAAAEAATITEAATATAEVVAAAEAAAAAVGIKAAFFAETVPLIAAASTPPSIKTHISQ